MERGNEIETAEQDETPNVDEDGNCVFCGEPRGNATPCPHCGMQ